MVVRRVMARARGSVGVVAVALLMLGGCGGHDGVAATDARVVDGPVACDAVDQDCPDGDKCTFVDPEADGFERACVAPTGTRAEGDRCVRGADGPAGLGHDDCAPGLFCSFIGVVPPSAGGSRLCRRACEADAGCATGQRCAVLADGQGLCGPTCAAFGPCAGGMSCADAWTGTGGDRDLFLVCRVAGPVALGQPCGLDDECGADAICLTELFGVPSVCAALCDGEHPCATGTCQELASGAPGVCTP